MFEGLLFLLVEEKASHDQVIHVRSHEARVGFFWTTHDGFPPDVERRVDDDRAARLLVEFVDCIVVQWMTLSFYCLDPG